MIVTEVGMHLNVSAVVWSNDRNGQYLQARLTHKMSGESCAAPTNARRKHSKNLTQHFGAFGSAANRRVSEMNQKKSSKELLNGDQREDEWSKVTRGERYIIRTTSQETNGVYSMLEIVVDPRNGVPMHVHDNEEEHFIVLEGKVLIANGDSRAEVGAGSSVTIGRGVPHAWCNLSEDVPLRMLVVFSPGGLEELFRQTSLKFRKRVLQ
jgi:mannose-6-phosphate isomerase-like protein (cupin superfamily)